MSGLGGKLARAALWGGATVAVGAVGAVGWAVGSIVWPNPARTFRRHGRPGDHGLAHEDVVLPDQSRAWFIPCPGAALTVIVAHGRSRDRSWMLPLIARLAQHHHVLAFDFPGHGENGFGRTTIGLREARTVHAAIDWVRERGVGPAVLHGVSMGGIAVLLALGARHRDEVIGASTHAVLDDLTSILELSANRAHMPHGLHKLSVRVSEAIAGYRVEAVRPIDAIEKVRVPLLITHGLHDELVPPACAERLAAAAQAPTRLLLLDAMHDEPEDEEHIDAILAFCSACLNAPPPVDAP